MWEHGMPGSAWTMAADLLRWEELQDDTDDDLTLLVGQEADGEPDRARWQRVSGPRQGSRWRRRLGTFTLTALAGAVVRGS
jgi:hypothetical protein